MDDRSNSSVCADGERDIVYAWALDAPAKEFPEGSAKLLLLKASAE